MKNNTPPRMRGDVILAKIGSSKLGAALQSSFVRLKGFFNWYA
jgi:hypothetical protein